MQGWAGRGWQRSGPLSGEIEEPLSWLLAVTAMAFALEGPRMLDPNTLKGPVVVGVFLGFVLHELAHRQVARRYGAAASFVATPTGLLITFISGLTPIAILAPGYVRVAMWTYNPRGAFYSVAAGPATNIAIALASYLAASALPYPANIYVNAVGKINAYIALFNLIPIGPLDGAKIANYNPATWGALVAAALALYLI